MPENRYRTFTKNITSTEDLADLVIQFDSETNLLQIAKDETIHEFFTQRGIPVNNREEMEEFRNAIYDELEQRVKQGENGTALQTYRAQTAARRLPGNITRLNSLIQNTEPVIEAAIQGILYAMEIPRKSTMEENGEEAINPYPGKVHICYVDTGFKIPQAPAILREFIYKRSGIEIVITPQHQYSNKIFQINFFGTKTFPVKRKVPINVKGNTTYTPTSPLFLFRREAWDQNYAREADGVLRKLITKAATDTNYLTQVAQSLEIMVRLPEIISNLHERTATLMQEQYGNLNQQLQEEVA